MFEAIAPMVEAAQHSCSNCGAFPATMRCGRCEAVRYCNAFCENAHRKAHHIACKEHTITAAHIWKLKSYNDYRAVSLDTLRSIVEDNEDSESFCDSGGEDSSSDADELESAVCKPCIEPSKSRSLSLPPYKRKNMDVVAVHSQGHEVSSCVGDCLAGILRLVSSSAK